MNAEGKKSELLHINSQLQEKKSLFFNLFYNYLFSFLFCGGKKKSRYLNSFKSNFFNLAIMTFFSSELRENPNCAIKNLQLPF